MLISADEYASLEETAHLLRPPANAVRLLESLQQAARGQATAHDLVDPDTQSPAE